LKRQLDSYSLMVKSLVKYFLNAGAILYFALLIYLTFFARRRRGEHNFRDKVNFAFLDKVWQAPQLNHQKTVALLAEVFGNIAAFLPFATALCIIFRRRFTNKQILFIVLCSTFTIECLQFAFSVGIFDIDDVFLNFIGGAAGIIIVDFLFKKLGYENFDTKP
jgi:glycopeptide antibiotics resistance protein